MKRKICGSAGGIRGSGERGGTTPYVLPKNIFRKLIINRYQQLPSLATEKETFGQVELMVYSGFIMENRLKYIIPMASGNFLLPHFQLIRPRIISGQGKIRGAYIRFIMKNTRMEKLPTLLSIT